MGGFHHHVVHIGENRFPLHYECQKLSQYVRGPPMNNEETSRRTDVLGVETDDGRSPSHSVSQVPPTFVVQSPNQIGDLPRYDGTWRFAFTMDDVAGRQLAEHTLPQFQSKRVPCAGERVDQSVVVESDLRQMCENHSNRSSRYFTREDVRFPLCENPYLLNHSPEAKGAFCFY